jgi:hypothetical protein
MLASGELHSLLDPSIHFSQPAEPEQRCGICYTWRGPGFYRLFEVSSGEFLGESIVFDRGWGDGRINWGDWDAKAQRSVWMDGFLIATTDKCSDKKAQAFILRYMQEKGALRRAAAAAVQARFKLEDSQAEIKVQIERGRNP